MDGIDGGGTAARVFRVTPAARRRMQRDGYRRLAVSGLVIVAVVLAATGGRLDQVHPIVWLLMLAAAGFYVLHVTNPDLPNGLVVDAEGIELDDTNVRLRAPWGDVVRPVRLRRPEGPAALQLARPSVTWENDRRQRVWRRRPYRYDQVIPLGPFLEGEDPSPAREAILAAAPHLDFAGAPVLAPVDEPWSRRIPALLAVGLPVGIAMGAVSILTSTTGLAAALPEALTMGALLGVIAGAGLFGWTDGTGERMVDRIGRVVVEPAAGERRTDVLPEVIAHLGQIVPLVLLATSFAWLGNGT